MGLLLNQPPCSRPQCSEPLFLVKKLATHTHANSIQVAQVVARSSWPNSGHDQHGMPDTVASAFMLLGTSARPISTTSGRHTVAAPHRRQEPVNEFASTSALSASRNALPSVFLPVIEVLVQLRSCATYIQRGHLLPASRWPTSCRTLVSQGSLHLRLAAVQRRRGHVAAVCHRVLISGQQVRL